MTEVSLDHNNEYSKKADLSEIYGNVVVMFLITNS